MASSSSPSKRVAERAKSAVPGSFERLARYLAYAPISSEPAAAPKLQSLAQTLVADLTTLGLSRARVLTLEGAHPCVAAEWMGAGPDKPTILIYGHFDVQPVAGEAWTTSPHDLVRKGARVYGR